MNYSVATLLLLAVVGTFWWLDQQPKAKSTEAAPASQAAAVSAKAAVPAPVSAPLPATGAPGAAPITADGRTPEVWYNLRELSLTTPSGLVTIAPGSIVQRLTPDSIFHQGRKYLVLPADLTSDPVAAYKVARSGESADQRFKARKDEAVAMAAALDAEITSLEASLRTLAAEHMALISKKRLSTLGPKVAQMETKLADLQRQRKALVIPW